MSFRDKASFGKRHEYIAVAELLKRGYDVYMTLVDDQQIDCVVRREVRSNPVYLDIQIKARSKECSAQNSGRFAALKIRKPRANFFFIFYLEVVDTYWVMPSTDVVRHASRNKTGKNKGLYTIVFANVSSRTRKVTLRDEFEAYRDNFDILKKGKARV